MPNTAAAVLHEAQAHMGVSGRPNLFTRWYADLHGDEFLDAAWCDMKVTRDAVMAGAAKAALPGGHRAYTVWHAQDFKDAGLWVSGTTANIKDHAYPGCVIFFDWNGTDSIGAIDHVGYVVKNLGDGRCVTIEGNTSDSVKLRVRGADVIAGFGTPKYDMVKPPVVKPVNTYPYRAGVFMRKGWQNSNGVMVVQNRLNALGYAPKLMTDGDFGTKTEKAVLWYQCRTGLAQDGIVGPKTWGKLFPVHP